MDIAWIGVATGTSGLVISGLAYRVNRKNARRDEARWHDQRTPNLTVEGFNERGGGAVISFITHNPAGLDRVTVTLLTEPGERSPVAGLSRTTTDKPWTKGAVGPLKLGEPVELHVWQNGPMRGHLLRLRCVCEIAGEKWPLYRECELPAEYP